jgi:hypothetical protein
LNKSNDECQYAGQVNKPLCGKHFPCVGNQKK